MYEKLFSPVRIGRVEIKNLGDYGAGDRHALMPTPQILLGWDRHRLRVIA